MRGRRSSIGSRAALVTFTVALFATTIWAATEKKLHNFGDGVDGVDPLSGLIFNAGNLYGTTYTGGSYRHGTVFELTPNGSGGWTEKVLHNFGSGLDGASPNAGLIFDADGNIYGTTGVGGDYGYGTVFEMTPNGSGGWTEKKLHNFNDNGRDGYHPSAGLVFDAHGNLYGTTFWGGDYPCDGPGCGTVFELTPNGSGGWTEKKLHNFGSADDGAFPDAGLIFDAAGNLYGTTSQGGDYSAYNGTVFELTPEEDGNWTEKKLHNFGHGTDGASPLAGLIFDHAGNLYGTTYYGGDHSVGTVFELTPNGSGGWTEKRLHDFDNNPDGNRPAAGLIFDAAGNLYGTTSFGGDYPCSSSRGCGTVFEMTPNGSGGWTEKKLHNFAGGSDGALPQAGLIFDADGNLYSTTSQGGDYGYGDGTVFEIIP